jgi:transposase
LWFEVLGEVVMAIGRREESQQQEFWMPVQNLSRGPGHVFYDKLNQVLAKAGFDRILEDLCGPYYAKTGRMSIPPGVYFRMLLVGYFEGIDSQRGIAWRCEDSLSLRRFLGISLGKETPDHSSLTRIRDRLPLEIHEQVFQQVLSIIDQHGLLKLKSVGVDSTLLEANAAMKSIVRKDSGEDWKAYLKRLMQEEGLLEEGDDPSDDELRKFDKARHKQGKKKVSNEDWQSPSDPDARIIKMKDGRTHLGYKAEHVVDLDNEIILSATVHHGTQSDAGTLMESVVNAQRNVILAGSPEEIEEVSADKGYHLCETGGARRTWLRGIEKVNKRYQIVAAARNLGLLMLKAFGIGKPRHLQGGRRAFLALWGTCVLLWTALKCIQGSLTARTTLQATFPHPNWKSNPQQTFTPKQLKILLTSTGC